jgi:hypothetical protein
MTMLDKKEMKFEELNSVTGGNAVGPVNETVPHGIGPNDYPYKQNTGPLGTGPIDYPYKQNTLPPYDPKIGPLPPNTCDPPIKRA